MTSIKERSFRGTEERASIAFSSCFCQVLKDVLNVNITLWLTLMSPGIKKLRAIANTAFLDTKLGTGSRKIPWSGGFKLIVHDTY